MFKNPDKDALPEEIPDGYELVQVICAGATYYKPTVLEGRYERDGSPTVIKERRLARFGEVIMVEKEAADKLYSINAVREPSDSEIVLPSGDFKYTRKLDEDQLADEGTLTIAMADGPRPVPANSPAAIDARLRGQDVPLVQPSDILAGEIVSTESAKDVDPDAVTDSETTESDEETTGDDTQTGDDETETQEGETIVEGEVEFQGEDLEIQEMSVEQLKDWLLKDSPNISEVVEAVNNDPETAKRMLEAEKLATNGSPRKGVDEQLTQIIEDDED